MTSSWVPDLDEARGPLHWRIAVAIGRDVRSGRLSAGERLPTHRGLAEALGVTANTVTKAYAEAERNGLVVSRTGRGTYVQAFPEEMAADTTGPQNLINFRTNDITSAHFNSVFNRVMGALSRRGLLFGLLEQHDHPGLDRHRAAGARWISRRGIDTKANRVILCNGAQHGLLAALSATTRPRDTVLTEKLTYAGLRFIADTLQVNLCGVETDEHGLIPEELEAACQREKTSVILVNPTNQNPTNVIYPIERRKTVVEIAERAGALIVEDDILGHVSGDDTPTMAALAPDRCIYVCGLSKSIAAGLRVGYILPPSALVDRVIDRLTKAHWCSPVLMGEIATLLIEDGHADEFVAWHRREALARHTLAREMLGLETGTATPSYHMWVPLPEPWRATEFAAELRAQGVLVASSEQFAVDRGSVPHAVRLAFGLVPDPERLREGLRLVAESYKSQPNRLHNIR
jgi:DNA-binding transcriptional MocR family regulator